MRAILLLLVIFLIPTAAGCGNSLGPSDDGTRGLPSAAIATSSLEATWSLTLREVGQPSALLETAVRAMVADGVLEFATADGAASVLFSVENLDPRATACHPNGVVLADACIDRGAFPYVIFDRSPVLELYLGGRRCLVPRDGSAGQITVDRNHTLYTVRAIAPATCPGADDRVFEVSLARLDSDTAFGGKPQLGDSGTGEVTLLGD